MHKEQKNEFEQKNTKFDLGPLSSLKPGISISDFENSVIDDESLHFITVALDRKKYQRFAVNGKLLIKGPYKKNYFFFQPSLPSTATDEDMKARENIYGTGKVVKALKELTGIVHDKTDDIRKKAAIKENNRELLEILNSRVETGFSIEIECENNNIIFITNRGGANRSSHDVNKNAKFALFYRESIKSFYHKNKQHFYNKNSETLEYDLGRSAMEPLTHALGAAINKSINGFIIDQKLTTLEPQENRCLYGFTSPLGGCFSYYYDRIWEKDIRYNKENFAKYLQKTLYVATAFSDDAKPGEFWTTLSDAEIVWNVLDIAKTYDLTLNPNEIPSDLPLCKIPPLMCAARRKSDDALRMVMMLVENGANVFMADDSGKTALDYAQESGSPDVVVYLQGIIGLHEAIVDSDSKQIEVHLHSGLIDYRRPIHNGLTPLALASVHRYNSDELKTIINFLTTDKESLDTPLQESKKTALYFAAINNNLRGVNLLLNAGADPKMVLAHPESFKISKKIKGYLENWGNPQFIRSHLITLNTQLSKLKKFGETDWGGLNEKNIKALTKLQIILVAAQGIANDQSSSFQTLYDTIRYLCYSAYEIMLSEQQQEEESTSLSSGLFGPRTLAQEIDKAIESSRQLFS